MYKLKDCLWIRIPYNKNWEPDVQINHVNKYQKYLNDDVFIF